MASRGWGGGHGGGDGGGRGYGGGGGGGKDPERSVYVGNIPWNASEDELKELFSQAGPVAGFRIVYDKESGRSKGFGFCEFFDEASASQAVSKMNNYEMYGRRLRVDRSR